MNIAVLFVPTVSNLQFRNLNKALIDSGCDVNCNIDEFWNPSKIYDILHIQFPEFLYGYSQSRIKIYQRKIEEKVVRQLKYFNEIGTKIIWTAFNIKGHEQKYYGERNLVYNEISKTCHGIITMGPSYHDFLKKIYPELMGKPMVVIPHGHYIDSYSNNISKIDARKLLNINKNKIVLLVFGLQRKYKNIYFIYKAFKKVHKTNDKVQLLIAGAPWGIKRRVLLKLLDLFYSDIIIEPRYINDDEIQIFFNASDIAVFSFKNMITSGSIILAQSFGLPVIVPNIGCFPDIVTKSTGFVYNNNDVDSCVEEIHNCVNSDFKRIGKAGKTTLESTSWNQIGHQTKLFYEQILKNEINH